MKRLTDKASRVRRAASMFIFAFSILFGVSDSQPSAGGFNLAAATNAEGSKGGPEKTGYSVTAGMSDYTYSISGKVSLTDFRKWCDPAHEPAAAQYRVRCTRLASVALPYARVYAMDGSLNTPLGIGRTDKDGAFKISWTSTKQSETRTVRIETDFTGFPRDVNYASFQVYSNPDVQGPPDLKDVCARTPVRAATAAVTCTTLSCDAGSLSLNNNTGPTLQNVSAVYLSLNYAYTDDLYVAAYHDYCMGLAKAGSSCPYNARHAVINVSDGDTTAGNETGFIQMNHAQAQYGAILHEFGHSLEFWAGKLTPGTGGPYTPTEAWANFVRLAYQYSRGATIVKDYDGYDIENQEPLCDNDNNSETPLVPYSQGKSSPYCKPEAIGVNWRASFWDLYDRNQETTQYACEPIAEYGYKGDTMTLSFAKMLEAWRNSLQYGTANHGWAEASSGDNTSTNNLYDYVYNLSVVSGVPFWQVEQTGIYHACQTKQPSD